MKIGDNVVCVKLPTRCKQGDIKDHPRTLKIGEIYSIIAIKEDSWFQSGLAIKIDGNPIWHGTQLFRPVDDTFGEVVCESIEQLIEVEQFEKQNK